MKVRFMYSYRIFTLVIIVFFFFTRCDNISRHEAFDQNKWKSYIDFDGSDRDEMAQDLLTDNKLKGLTYTQMLELLGPPANYEDSTKTYYELSQQFDMIDPVSGKNLIITFNRDSIITRAEIKEWHKN